jgi:hypothetical protein
MKLHIKEKRNKPYVFCGDSVSRFDKVERYDVGRLVKWHGKEDYFCKKCLKLFKNKEAQNEKI